MSEIDLNIEICSDCPCAPRGTRRSNPPRVRIAPAQALLALKQEIAAGAQRPRNDNSTPPPPVIARRL